MGFVIQPVSFIDVPISVFETTKAMSFVILPLTSEFVKGWKSEVTTLRDLEALK